MAEVAKVYFREGQTALLERFAVHLEQSGQQPAPAKVMALLMISDEPQLSFDVIMETLGISKSATSQAINQLLMQKRVEYVTRIGERKRYFQVRMGNIVEDIKAISAMVAESVLIYKDILDQRPGETKEFNSKVKKMVDFLSFISIELPLLVEKFDANKK